MGNMQVLHQSACPNTLWNQLCWKPLVMNTMTRERFVLEMLRLEAVFDFV